MSRLDAFRQTICTTCPKINRAWTKLLLTTVTSDDPFSYLNKAPIIITRLFSVNGHIFWKLLNYSWISKSFSKNINLLMPGINCVQIEKSVWVKYLRGHRQSLFLIMISLWFSAFIARVIKILLHFKPLWFFYISLLWVNCNILLMSELSSQIFQILERKWKLEMSKASFYYELEIAWV